MNGRPFELHYRQRYGGDLEKAEYPTGARSIDRVLSLVCGIGGPLILLTTIFIAGRLHPDYSHLSQPVSALGAEGAPYRVIADFGGLVPAGVLTLVFSVIMFRNIKGNWLLRSSAVLVTLVGAGRLLAGIFPCDPGCLHFSSTSAKIHAVAGITALSAGVFAPLTFAVGMRSCNRRGWYRLSLILGLGAVLTLCAGVSQLWPRYMGLFQRVLLILAYTWIIAVAIGIGIKRNLSYS